MAPYIVSVKYWEIDVDANIHRQNFVIYAASYADAVTRIADYVDDLSITSITVTCVADTGSLVSVPDEVAEDIIKHEGWFSYEDISQ